MITPEDELADLETRGLLRTLRSVVGPQTTELFLDGRRVINFSSNNYLGLADHPRLIAAATRAMARDGFGAGASRLIAGNLEIHRLLEQRVIAWQGTEAALLFNSGYHANLGTITALAGAEDAIYSDALNHASLIDGARLSRSSVHVYPHLDLATLDRQLRDGSRFRRRLIVTDSVFSMDGDRAPLQELVALARRFDALTYVDDAHAVGVLGEGVGLARGLDVDLHMGTLGKALGGFGAFVAGRASFIELLKQRARTFVFTTALPVPVAAAGLAAIDLVAGEEGQLRRQQLERRCQRFFDGLARLGLATTGAPSHVVPLLVGEPGAAMMVCERLLERGIYAQAIRPPTVPVGTSRLRFALAATHTDAHIDGALDALAELRHFLRDP